MSAIIESDEDETLSYQEYEPGLVSSGLPSRLSDLPEQVAVAPAQERQSIDDGDVSFTPLSDNQESIIGSSCPDVANLDADDVLRMSTSPSLHTHPSVPRQLHNHREGCSVASLQSEPFDFDSDDEKDLASEMGDESFQRGWDEFEDSGFLEDQDRNSQHQAPYDGRGIIDDGLGLQDLQILETDSEDGEEDRMLEQVGTPPLEEEEGDGEEPFASHGRLLRLEPLLADITTAETVQQSFPQDEDNSFDFSRRVRYRPPMPDLAVPAFLMTATTSLTSKRSRTADENDLLPDVSSDHDERGVEAVRNIEEDGRQTEDEILGYQKKAKKRVKRTRHEALAQPQEPESPIVTENYETRPDDPQNTASQTQNPTPTNKATKKKQKVAQVSDGRPVFPLTGEPIPDLRIRIAELMVNPHTQDAELKRQAIIRSLELLARSIVLQISQKSRIVAEYRSMEFWRRVYQGTEVTKQLLDDDGDVVGEERVIKRKDWPRLPKVEPVTVELIRRGVSRHELDQQVEREPARESGPKPAQEVVTEASLTNPPPDSTDAAGVAQPVRQICWPRKRTLKTSHGLGAKELAIFVRVLEIVLEGLRKKRVSTKRDVYYKDMALFGKQAVVDQIIDDLAATLAVRRSDLFVVASSKGLFSGNLTIILNDEGSRELDGLSGTQGVLIPPAEAIDRLKIVEQVRFVLLVEKEAVFRTLCETRFFDHARLGKSIVLTGKGYPDVATRELVKALADELPASTPIYCLVDADPHGVEILSTYKFGSVAMAFDQENLAAGRIEWLGLKMSQIRSGQEERGGKSIKLSMNDHKKALRILSRNYIPGEWRKELNRMLHLRRKAEIEILSSSRGRGGAEELVGEGLRIAEDGSAGATAGLHNDGLIEYLVKEVSDRIGFLEPM